MGTMRGGGLGLGISAERGSRGRGARSGQTDLPKRKPNLKKLWPQIRALIAPRKGLIIGGLLFMMGLIADLIATNRKLLERVHLRLQHIQHGDLRGNREVDAVSISTER